MTKSTPTLLVATNENDIPRCPLCHARMTEAQLKWEEIPGTVPPKHGWHEVWNCDSCHTNHVFPARIEFLQKVRNSQQMPRSDRVLHLPF